jgi:hypothetical protein
MAAGMKRVAVSPMVTQMVTDWLAWPVSDRQRRYQLAVPDCPFEIQNRTDRQPSTANSMAVYDS